MADWKYIMFRVDDRSLPIIFPGDLVHRDVAEYMRRPIAHLGKGSPTTATAGFISALQVIETHGRSESLNRMSSPGDASIINTMPYNHGRENVLDIEMMLGLRFTEMLIAKLGGKP